MDDHVHELLAEVKLGHDAQEFLNTDLGRFLLGRCRQEIDEATEKLKRIERHAHTEIGRLQDQIWRAESFEAWLVELIHAGNEALHTLETGEAND